MSKVKIIQNSTDQDSAVSPLVRLAMSFHQDFALLVSNPDDMAQFFIDRLTEPERKLLAREIGDLLRKYPGKDQRGLKRAWFKLGAQWKATDFDLMSAMERWVMLAD